MEEVCRKAGISVRPYCLWWSKCGGLVPAEMKRPKQLDAGSGRLGRLVAGLSLDKEMLQDVLKRKLCGLIESIILSMWFGRPGRCWSGGPAVCSGSTPRPATNGLAAPIRPRFGNEWEIVETRGRYSYRQVHVLLRHDCWDISHKRT